MRRFLLLAAFALAATAAHAWEEEPQISTEPIGSSFYRHLAHDKGLDLRELVKFEKKGFGRSEILMLITISSATHVSLKDLGNRRLKEKLSLETLAKEANLNYDQLLRDSHAEKRRIEAKGDNDLPPPVYEQPSPVPTPTPKPEKKKKKKKDEK